MSEFDNNDVYETVENPEPVDSTPVTEESTTGSFDTDTYAGTTDNTYNTTADNTYTETVNDGYNAAPDYSQNTYYEQPASSEEGSKTLAIISLVCGIVSLLCSCCGWYGMAVSVAAIVLGILSISKKENAKGMAIAGIVCGGVGLLIGIATTIMGAAFSSMDENQITQMVERLESL